MINIQAVASVVINMVRQGNAQYVIGTLEETQTAIRDDLIDEVMKWGEKEHGKKCVKNDIFYIKLKELRSDKKYNAEN